uniref:Uncharacterized protein n=1 Tax=Triticum urartu TaxID=4572 RepID=A0A8R7TWW1_TRIUA
MAGFGAPRASFIFHMLQEGVNCHVGRPTFLDGVCSHPFRHGRPLSKLLPFLRLHYQPHLGLHLLGLDGRLLVALHRHPNLHLLHQVYLVQPLLRVQRPADHRHAGHDRLQRRVPPAVRHERSHGLVSQHLRLWRPVLQNQAPVSGSLQETIRKQRLQVRFAGLALLLAWATHGPQEPVPGVL